MEIFKIRQDGIKEIRNRLLMRSIPIMVLAAAAGIIITTINSSEKDIDINIWPIFIPLIAIAFGFGIYIGMKKQKALLESYTLTITNNLITREQLDTATISIYFNDIREIVKNKNGSFIINGKDAGDTILIPLQIDKYVQLEATLQQIQPIVVKASLSFIEKYQSLIGYLTLGLMICVYTAKDKILIALSGSVLVTLMIVSLINIRKNKNVDNKTKRTSWLVLLVLASVISAMIFKLTGLADLQK